MSKEGKLIEAAVEILDEDDINPDPAAISQLLENALEKSRKAESFEDQMAEWQSDPTTGV